MYITNPVIGVDVPFIAPDNCNEYVVNELGLIFDWGQNLDITPVLTIRTDIFFLSSLTQDQVVEEIRDELTRLGFKCEFGEDHVCFDESGWCGSEEEWE